MRVILTWPPSPTGECHSSLLSNFDSLTSVRWSFSSVCCIKLVSGWVKGDFQFYLVSSAGTISKANVKVVLILFWYNYMLNFEGGACPEENLVC